MPDHREKKERREKKRVRNHFRKRFFTWSRTFCLQGSYLGTRFIPPCRFSFGEKGGKAKSRGRPNRPIYKRLTLVLNERTQRRGTRSTHHIRLSAKNRACFFITKTKIHFYFANHFFSFSHQFYDSLGLSKNLRFNSGQPTRNDESFSRHLPTNGKIRSRTYTSTTAKKVVKRMIGQPIQIYYHTHCKVLSRKVQSRNRNNF